MSLRSKVESLSPPAHAEVKYPSGTRVRVPVTFRAIILVVVITAALALWLLRGRLG